VFGRLVRKVDPPLWRSLQNPGSVNGVGCPIPSYGGQFLRKIRQPAPSLKNRFKIAQNGPQIPLRLANAASKSILAIRHTPHKWGIGEGSRSKRGSPAHASKTKPDTLHLAPCGKEMRSVGNWSGSRGAKPHFGVFNNARRWKIHPTGLF